MRVVQVAPYPARQPVSGSQQRIHGLTVGRDPSDSVDRFAPVPGEGLVGDGAVETFDLDENYRERQYAVGRQPGIRTLSRLAPRTVADAQSAFEAFASARMRVHAPAELDATLRDADVAVVEHPWQFRYVSRRAGDTPVVYSSHNVETEYHAFLGDRLATRPLLAAVERAERRAVAEADLVVTTSERDGETYRERFGRTDSYHVAPNAAADPSDPPTDTDEVPSDVPADQFTCLFVGTAHRPNRIAAEHLLEVARETPSVAFVVVGTVGTVLDASDAPENVHVTGYVPDLDPFYAGADLALNPITAGSGSNVKVPTYFAAGLPVLSTPFGTRGLPVTDGEHCLVAPLDAFPETIGGAASGAVELDALAQRARDLVDTELNWTSVSASLFERLGALVDGSASPPKRRPNRN